MINGQNQRDDVTVILVAYQNNQAEIDRLLNDFREGFTLAGTPHRIVLVANDYSNVTAGPEDVTISGHGNIGFARACALAADQVTSRNVLIANIDLRFDPRQFAAFLRRNSALGTDVVVPILADTAGAANIDAYHNSTMSISRIANRRRSRRILNTSGQTALPQYMKAPGAFIYMSSEVAQAYGPFDSAFLLYAEDRDLTRRLRRDGFKCVLDSTLTVTHLGGPPSRTVSPLVDLARLDGSLRIAARSGSHRQLRVRLVLLESLLIALLRGAVSRRSIQTLRFRWRLGRRWLSQPKSTEAPPIDFEELEALTS